MIKSVICILNSKIVIEPTTKELINKTQLSPKIIPTLSCRFGNSNKRILLHISYCCPSAPTNDGSQSSQVSTTQYKNCKGEFTTKETSSYQITIIRKRNNNKCHAHTQLSMNTTYI